MAQLPLKSTEIMATKTTPDTLLVLAHKNPPVEKTGFVLEKPEQIYYQGRITRAGAIYRFWQLNAFELIKLRTANIRSQIARVELFTPDDSNYLVSELHKICAKTLEEASSKSSKKTIEQLRSQIIRHMDSTEKTILNNIRSYEQFV